MASCSFDFQPLRFGPKVTKPNKEFRLELTALAPADCNVVVLLLLWYAFSLSLLFFLLLTIAR